jgi:formylglycine-generating enzyme
VTGAYFDYPTGSNTQPNSNLPSGDTGNSANIITTPHPATVPHTDAGAYLLSDSPYGTFDQAGNVTEWTESLHSNTPGIFAIRGSGAHTAAISARKDQRLSGISSTSGLVGLGFRVVEIPEPGAGWLMAIALSTLRRRRGRE